MANVSLQWRVSAAFLRPYGLFNVCHRYQLATVR
jgi:hypothetical protein